MICYCPQHLLLHSDQQYKQGDWSLNYSCVFFASLTETISSTTMKIPKIHNPLFIAVVATLGGMLFGFDISSMSAIILTDQYRDFFNNPSGVKQGAIGSSLAAGSVFGSAIAGPFSDWIGRRNSIFYSCFFWIAGTVLQTATNGFGMLVAGRILNGMYWFVGDVLVVMLGEGGCWPC
jgi:MFS family permease